MTRSEARALYEQARLELRLHHTPRTRYPSRTSEEWRADHRLLKRRVLEAARKLDELEEQ